MFSVYKKKTFESLGKTGKLKFEVKEHLGQKIPKWFALNS